MKEPGFVDMVIGTALALLLWAHWDAVSATFGRIFS